MKEKKICVNKNNGEQLVVTFIFDSEEVYIKEYKKIVKINRKNFKFEQELENFFLNFKEEITKEDILKELEKITKKEDLKKDELYLKIVEKMKEDKGIYFYF